MRNIEIFISNGGDTNAYRDLASDAIARLRQVLQFEMNLSVTISYWDYRNAPPTVVPSGTLAATSLTNVDRSHALVAIFGKRVPSITKQEIDRAFARRQNGAQQEVFVFARPDQLTEEHWNFFRAIGTNYGEEIVFGHYSRSRR